ncbi:MAG: cytochrome b/b6 domain-containing protein, partial [Pseudomonadota bacterium]
MSQSAIMNTQQRYGLVAQLFHWVTAFLILILLPLGLYMYQLPISTSEEIADKVWLYSLHKTLGMTALIVAMLRVVWAVLGPSPAPLHPERKLETFAAATVHWMLYISILLVPVVGYVHHAASVGFAPIWGPFPQEMPFIPKSVELSKYTGLMHFILAAMMGVSIVLHVAGAMKHAVI